MPDDFTCQCGNREWAIKSYTLYILLMVGLTKKSTDVVKERLNIGGLVDDD